MFSSLKYVLNNKKEEITVTSGSCISPLKHLLIFFWLYHSRPPLPPPRFPLLPLHCPMTWQTYNPLRHGLMFWVYFFPVLSLLSVATHPHYFHSFLNSSLFIFHFLGRGGGRYSCAVSAQPCSSAARLLRGCDVASAFKVNKHQLCIFVKVSKRWPYLNSRAISAGGLCVRLWPFAFFPPLTSCELLDKHGRLRSLMSCICPGTRFIFLYSIAA